MSSAEYYQAKYDEEITEIKNEFPSYDRAIEEIYSLRSKNAFLNNKLNAPKRGRGRPKKQKSIFDFLVEGIGWEIPSAKNKAGRPIRQSSEEKQNIIRGLENAKNTVFQDEGVWLTDKKIIERIILKNTDTTGWRGQEEARERMKKWESFFKYLRDSAGIRQRDGRPKKSGKLSKK